LLGHHAAGANIDSAVMTLGLKLHKDDATRGQVYCANFVLSQALMYEEDLKPKFSLRASATRDHCEQAAGTKYGI
jgi:uncharacterized protein with beta-barrel porin domain